MADVIYYLGAEAEDFATISAAFKQMARDVELHFAAFPEELLARLNRERGLTVLMVNHDLAAMRQYTGQIIWIREGKALTGPTAELLRQERVAELLDLQFS